MTKVVVTLLVCAMKSNKRGWSITTHKPHSENVTHYILVADMGTFNAGTRMDRNKLREGNLYFKRCNVGRNV